MLTEIQYEELKKLREKGFNWLQSGKDKTIRAYAMHPKTGISFGNIGGYSMDVTEFRFETVMNKNEIVNITTLIDGYLTEQLSKCGKVQIPQFVAGWIEDRKQIHTLKGLFDSDKMPADVRKWTAFNDENCKKMALAWIFGYEILKEKYTVELPNKQRLASVDGVIKFCDEATWFVGGLNTHLTKEEIESIDPMLMNIAKEVKS